MRFPDYSWQYMRPIEDVFLPGDREHYLPVVLRSREYRGGRIDSDIAEVLRAQWLRNNRSSWFNN